MRYVVNTHWHWDHTDGDGWLREAGATVLATPATRKYMSKATRIDDWNHTFPASAEVGLFTELIEKSTTYRLDDETGIGPRLPAWGIACVVASVDVATSTGVGVATACAICVDGAAESVSASLVPVATAEGDASVTTVGTALEAPEESFGCAEVMGTASCSAALVVSGQRAKASPASEQIMPTARSHANGFECGIPSLSACTCAPNIGVATDGGSYPHAGIHEHAFPRSASTRRHACARHLSGPRTLA